MRLFLRIITLPITIWFIALPILLWCLDRYVMKGRLWAVAYNVSREVFRMRGLMIFMIFLTLLYTVCFAIWVHNGTGEGDEKVQTYLSYSLSFAVTILSFFAIFISILTISREIKEKDIFMVTTKPIRRGEIFVGKLFGLFILNFIFVVNIGFIIYVVTNIMAAYSVVNENQRERLQDKVLVARKFVKPESLMIDEEVQRRVDEKSAEIIEEQFMEDPEVIEKMRKRLYKEYKAIVTVEKTSVEPSKQISFHFKDIAPIDAEHGYVYICYNQQAALTPESEKVIGEWTYSNSDLSHEVFSPIHTTYDLLRKPHEFKIDKTKLAKNGELFVEYRNSVLNYPASVIFPVQTGIEVRYVAGSFQENYLRCLLLIYFRLILISILGLSVGAFLSFPVATLILIVTFVLGLASNFILDAISWEADSVIHEKLIRYVMFFVPNYISYDPVPDIEKGRQVIGLSQIWFDINTFMADWKKPMPIKWNDLIGVLILKDLFVTTVVSIFGYLSFRFRELARVIV